MNYERLNDLRLLGLTIAYYRRAKGMTQAELAEAVHIQSYPYEQHRSAKQSYLSVSKQADGYCGSTRNSAENII